MSKNKTTFKTWDQYNEEAQGKPFELPVSEDKTIVVDPPSGAGIIQFNNAARYGDAEAMLAGIVGEQFTEIKELLKRPGSHKAMDNLIYDMMMHFDLAEEVDLVGPGGGTVTEKDPRKIKKLLNMGYKTVGEANART